MQIKYGSTRVVILIGKYAIKFPYCNEWKRFLYGLLGNIHERKWSRTNDYQSLKPKEKLCPVLFYCLGGFFLVMPRCEELTDDEFKTINFYEFTGSKEVIINDNPKTWITTGGLPVENKKESFGKLNNRIVAIDYGS